MYFFHLLGIAICCSAFMEASAKAKINVSEVSIAMWMSTVYIMVYLTSGMSMARLYFLFCSGHGYVQLGLVTLLGSILLCTGPECLSESSRSLFCARYSRPFACIYFTIWHHFLMFLQNWTVFIIQHGLNKKS